MIPEPDPVLNLVPVLVPKIRPHSGSVPGPKLTILTGQTDQPSTLVHTWFEMLLYLTS
jgi:hypothetical protein